MTFDLKKYMAGLSHEVYTDTMADVTAAYTALLGKFGAGGFQPKDVIQLVDVIQKERRTRTHVAGEIYQAEIQARMNRKSPH
tara:strand:- start:1604 stop:1849 length:246 start_codon:yes stop_codon:yes gene_type:complete